MTGSITARRKVDKSQTLTISTARPRRLRMLSEWGSGWCASAYLLFVSFVQATNPKVHVPWGTGDHVLCSAPEEPPGFFLFQYCTDTESETMYWRYGPTALPDIRNKYAWSGWMGCYYHYDVTLYYNSAACGVEGATRITWKANFCLQNFDWWQNSLHRGDPFLTGVPADPGAWDHWSRGIDVSFTSKPSTIKKRSGGSKNSVTIRYSDDEDPDFHIENVIHRTAESSIDLDISDHISSNSTHVFHPESKTLTKRRNDYGPYYFKYCTFNRLEAYLMHQKTTILERRFVSNQVANEAWLECDSAQPFVHTFEYSKDYCHGKGGQIIAWWAKNCHYPLDYYQKEEGDPSNVWDPQMFMHHERGCSYGIHVEGNIHQ